MSPRVWQGGWGGSDGGLCLLHPLLSRTGLGASPGGLDRSVPTLCREAFGVHTRPDPRPAPRSHRIQGPEHRSLPAMLGRCSELRRPGPSCRALRIGEGAVKLETESFNGRVSQNRICASAQTRPHHAHPGGPQDGTEVSQAAASLTVPTHGAPHGARPAHHPPPDAVSELLGPQRVEQTQGDEVSGRQPPAPWPGGRRVHRDAELWPRGPHAQPGPGS